MSELAEPDPSTLIALLRDNNGKLGNLTARRLLSQKVGQEISVDQYELLKEQLLSEGLIKKAQGRGGSIQILVDETCPSLEADDLEDKGITQSLDSPDPATLSDSSQGEKLYRLYTALDYCPGVRIKPNKKACTLFFGDDEDKLFCGWSGADSAYFIEYRAEPSKHNYSKEVEKIFKQVVSEIPGSTIARSSSNVVTLSIGPSVPVVLQAVRLLRAALDMTNIGGVNLSEDVIEETDVDYFYEISSLIKYCVDNRLYWPLKRWRVALGFDEVDNLIHIGSSPNGLTDKYREHVVPVSLIKDEAIKLAEKGAPVETIEDFIRHHLYIVWISFDEAEMLNTHLNKGGCSLKTSMPPGWVFGCDPLERLKDAGIQIHFHKPIAIEKWKGWRGHERERLRDKVKKFFLDL
jgi:hypothetical protein